MRLTRHATPVRPRWALNGNWLPVNFNLSLIMELPAASLFPVLAAMDTGCPADGPLLAPLDSDQEVWGAGVTYQRSREARGVESQDASLYDRVYAAERPQVFFKAAGWRVVGSGQPIGVRADSAWNVPEPELSLLANARGEIIGFTAGNDVTSRSIEGENPLYQPQGKMFTGSCALGAGIRLCQPSDMVDLPISLEIFRDGHEFFGGESSTASMKRSLSELTGCLFRALTFPNGVFLMTGTCIVPPDNFSLQPGDWVRVRVGAETLENTTI